MNYDHDPYGGIPITKKIQFEKNGGIVVTMQVAEEFRSKLDKVLEIMSCLSRLYLNLDSSADIIMKAKADGIITDSEFSLLIKYYWYI